MTRPPRHIATLVGCMALLVASAAQAQAIRPGPSVYVLLRGSVAGYSGDLDRNPDDSALDITDGFADPGFGVGGELGYLFNDNLSLGLGVVYQNLPVLDGSVGTANTVQDGDAYQVQALFRWLPYAGLRVAPFLEFGGALVLGQGTEDERNGGSADEDVWGYGPVVGLGLDLALTPRFGLFLGAQSTLVFPDVALDGSDPGAVGAMPDHDAFDVLTNLGGGLRYAFAAPGGVLEIEGLECPADLNVGDSGRFTVLTNDAATRPVATTWEWGDGTTGSGASEMHAYRTPGNYTVTVTATNPGGRASDTCLVTVSGEAPVLAGCRATPSSVNIGEQLTIDATASGAEDITVDFGDGSEASTLPARHAYGRSGTYRVTISASNDYGDDTCAVTVTVGDGYCESVSELNAVFFGYGATSVSAEAAGRLDETIEILRRCPDICVTINGYSDGAEPGDALRVSQARANAVREYYIARGIDAGRLRAVGRGVDPQSNPKEDPGQGDRIARRVDSVPTSCAGF